MTHDLKTESEMVETVRAYVARFATQKEAAEDLDISAQFLGDVLKGRRSVTDKIAKKLGYRRAGLYENNPPDAQPCPNSEGA